MTNRKFDKWRTVIALLIIYVAVLADWTWVWGLLFIMWTIPALYSREVHLVEAIHRDNNPILYWIIVCTWLALSIYLIVADVWKMVV